MSIKTFISVAYGDVYLITVVGKIIASFTAIMGIGINGMLVGIIGAAFMNVLKNNNLKPEIYSIEEKEKIKMIKNSNSALI